MYCRKIFFRKILVLDGQMNKLRLRLFDYILSLINFMFVFLFYLENIVIYY